MHPNAAERVQVRHPVRPGRRAGQGQVRAVTRQRVQVDEMDCSGTPTRIHAQLLGSMRQAALSWDVQVDVMAWSGKQTRIHAQLKDICAILSGLVVAQDYKAGQRLLVDRNFKDNAAFFQVAPPQLSLTDQAWAPDPGP